MGTAPVVIGQERHEEFHASRYARAGHSPLPYLVVGIGSILAVLWAIPWVQETEGATDPEREAQVWYTAATLVAPTEDIRSFAYSASRMWIGVGILAFAVAAIAVWIGRLGRNIRMGHSPFGSVLPLLALPAFWTLSLTIGMEGNDHSRVDLLIRYLVAFAVLFAQYLLLRWPLLNRIWRAGNLDYDMASILLWLVNLVPLSMLLLSTAYTLFVFDEGDPFQESAWEPTQNMADAALWTTRGTSLGILLLLVVVSVCQHVGLRRDRADAEALRAR